MTTDTIEAINVDAMAARIAALISSAQPQERRTVERTRWNEIRSLQRQLAEEFGRRNAWEHNNKWFSLCTLVSNGIREGSPCPAIEYPYVDHPYYYRKDRRACALAVHLYNATGRHDDIVAWAASNEMRASFPDFPSWWWPGTTTLVIYESNLLP
jgi:hypothetical protein